MKISWVTTSHVQVKSMVEYGKTPGKYEASATGEHTSYQFFLYRSGRIHQVTIGPLDPSTTYYYRCGGFGQEFELRTPPSTFPIEFAIVGKSLRFCVRFAACKLALCLKSGSVIKLTNLCKA